jgi:hypothetical protein
MLARVLPADLSAEAPFGAKAEAFPVAAKANSGWGHTIIVILGLPDAAVLPRAELNSPFGAATTPLRLAAKPGSENSDAARTEGCAPR